MKMSQIVKKIEFYGDLLSAVQIEDSSNETYTPAKPISEILTLEWSSQLKKLKAHPVLSSGLRVITIPELDSQPIVLIRSDLLPMWLIQVNLNKIVGPVRDKVIRYQTEAAKVLAEAFMGIKQQKPLTNAQLIAQMANEIAEQEQRQALLENKIFQVEQEVNAIKTHNDADYMCVKGYARNHGHKVDRALAQKIGRKCGKLFRQRLGLEPPKIEDELFGTVNLYTQNILTEVFNEHFQSKGEVA